MVWYEDEIRQLEHKIATLGTPTDKVVFYGSSSIRLWTTLAQDFPQVETLNLGFGGSTLAACAWYFERLVVPVAPKSLVFYAGDNDLGDGRHPEEVVLFFAAFAEKMSRLLPGVPMAFLSIKLSPARWHIAEQIKATNKFIRKELEKAPGWYYVDMTTPLLGGNGTPRLEFFEADGLHLTSLGYGAWRQALQQQNRIF